MATAATPIMYASASQDAAHPAKDKTTKIFDLSLRVFLSAHQSSLERNAVGSRKNE
ncbi:hypothetical protein [Moorella sp. E306M]|uniref:hypothetical protein n=1 Tax=Moorella sp. E306M TaxID=2572683 RepID=UPI0035A61F9F